MTTIDQQLASLRETIRNEERESLRKEILSSIGQQLGTSAPKFVAKPTKAVTKAGPGVKRSPEELAKTVSQVLAHVAEHPGVGAEHIRTALGTSLAVIELPIKKLLASKAIKRRGQRRATKYYPAVN